MSQTVCAVRVFVPVLNSDRFGDDKVGYHQVEVYKQFRYKVVSNGCFIKCFYIGMFLDWHDYNQFYECEFEILFVFVHVVCKIFDVWFTFLLY